MVDISVFSSRELAFMTWSVIVLIWIGAEY